MRKLVTVRTIDSLSPIEKADRIETAHIGGWPVVVKKGEFKEGDQCVFFEIDSVVPDCEPFLFLTEKSKHKFYNDRVGARLRTVRLRGQLSQGLALPVSLFDQSVLESEDIAEALDVWKYDPPPPACLAGQVEGYLPSWIIKTDEERIQNIDIQDLYDEDFEITEKLDGTSMSVWKDYDGKLGVGSRNLQLKINDQNKDNSFVKMAVESGILDALADDRVPNGTVVQGELIGPGIQGNPYQLQEPEFYIFMVQQHGTKLTPEEIMAFVDIDLYSVASDVRPIPYISTYYVFDALRIEEILEMANGPSWLNPSAKREGIVFRSLHNGNISFKAISNEYLLDEKS